MTTQAQTAIQLCPTDLYLAPNHGIVFHSHAANLTCLPILLHTVAAVVELCESGGQLIQVVA